MISAPELVAPAHLWVPAHSGSAGGEAADFAESVGMVLDAEQRLALDALLAERPDGRWAAYENGLICSRQNMKTFAFEVIALADLFLFDARLVVWSAHEFSTTLEAFRDLKDRIDGSDTLRRRVKKITEANGEEAIELRSGARLRFKARTKSGGRGLTGDTVFFDEAFALQPSMLGSLLPTLSARPNPHAFYGSSAGRLESGVLRAIRDRGRAGDDPSLTYVEWCAPRGGCAADPCDHAITTEGCALDDRERWRLANPTMGRRIAEEHIAAERRALPADEFARERLGWWEDPAGAGPLSDVEWADAADRASTAATVDAFAIDVAHDLSWSAIAVAGTRADGLAHLEVVKYARGTEWVAAEAARLAGEHGAPLAVPVKAPAEALLPDLRAAGLEPVEVTSAELTAACGQFADFLARGAFRHLGQPELDRAAKDGVRRLSGDSWVWSRRSSPVEISPIVAATIALSVARRHKPRRKARLHVYDH